MGIAALVLGTILVSLVAVQLSLATFTSLRHALRQRKREELSTTLLTEQIAAAKALQRRNEQTALAWSGVRKFEVQRKVCDADGVCSFYLVPHDRKPLAGFQAGQFLTFQLNVPHLDKPLVRCYSLSDCPREDYYRVTIKRVGAPPDKPEIPPGVSSNFFHDHVKEGDILDVKAPKGHFVLDPHAPRPAVLIGGGVGITPFLSMVNAVAASGSRRQTYLFYGSRHGGEQVMKDHLRQLAREHDNIHVVIVYSNPRKEDVQGRDYDHAGHVGVDLLRQHLITNNYQFYICGPPPMMEGLSKQLKSWGVPADDINSEAFGPASIQARKKAVAPKQSDMVEAEVKCVVTFGKSGKKIPWKSTATTILELAEAERLPLDSACRAGSCGTCQVAIRSGQVIYDDEPEWEIEEGCCLTCVGRPQGDVVLDA